jgi:transcriptional regulator with XRE-family HTH domain
MDQLKRLRVEKGLSQAKLAALADVDPSTVNQIERGAREASPATLRKLADALDVGIAELLEGTNPKAPRRSPYEPTLLNGLEGERLADWEKAVRSAEQLRERGRARIERLLSSWRDTRDRRALHGMGRLLQEAYDAETALVRYLEEDPTTGIRLDRISITDWDEVRKASRFYGALVGMVQGAGLHVRTEGGAHEVRNAA